MTEQPSPNGGQAAPPPDARYVPATTDARLMVRFVGNTAQVGGMQFVGPIDPFMLLAASEYLRYVALNSIRAVEQQAAGIGLRKGTAEDLKAAEKILRLGQH